MFGSSPCRPTKPPHQKPIDFQTALENSFSLCGCKRSAPMFCDLIFLIQRVGSKDIQTHTQTRRAEKRALLKSKIFNLVNDKEPLDFPIPGELNKDRNVQPSLRARSSPSVLPWTGYKNLAASERQRPRSETTANRIFTLHAPDLKSLISHDTAFPRNRFRNWIAAPSRT